MPVTLEGSPVVASLLVVHLLLVLCRSAIVEHFDVVVPPAVIDNTKSSTLLEALCAGMLTLAQIAAKCEGHIPLHRSQPAPPKYQAQMTFLETPILWQPGSITVLGTDAT